MTDVLFALLPHTVLLDVAGPAEAFRMANNFAPGSYSLRFVGSTPSVESGVGLQLSGLRPLPRKLPDGAIIVISGVVGRTLDLTAAAVERMAEWLRHAMQNETVTLVCVCAGSVVAAKAGVLKGLECTTHYAHLDELKRVEPTAQVHGNRIFVEEGRVFTSAGVTAGIDLALHVIGKQLGHRVVAAVARDLVVYMRRAGGDP
ncbi:MAG TPA: AraC family transcriptional regulator, partial [Steroidobacteraceae bacterium]|nr:AraC family transcriptional regulator [Steroidobacteraceae bacterium]